MQREKATHALRAWNPAKRVGCRSILHGEGARQGEGILPFPPGRSRAWGTTTAHPRKHSRKARAWTSPPQEKMNLAMSRMDRMPGKAPGGRAAHQDARPMPRGGCP